MSSNDNSINNNNNNNNNNWIEVKGRDLIVKVIESKTKNKLPTTNSTNDDDDDENSKPKSINVHDTVLIDIIGYQWKSSNIHPYDIEEETNTNTITNNNKINIIEKYCSPIIQNNKGLLVTVGEPYCLITAIDSCLSKLYEGQTAIIYSHSKYALHNGIRKYPTKNTNTTTNTTTTTNNNNNTNTNNINNNNKFIHVLKNSNMLYQIKIIQIVIDTSRLNPYFTIQKAITKKLIGNDLYQYEFESGKPIHERILKLYQKSANEMYKLIYEGTYFQTIENQKQQQNQQHGSGSGANEMHPQKKQAFDLMIDNYNNIVVIYMRLKQYKLARDAIQTVLKYDKYNIKALLRDAKIIIQLDPTIVSSLDESNELLLQLENLITYKQPKEEKELHIYRKKWNQLKKQTNNK